MPMLVCFVLSSSQQNIVAANKNKTIEGPKPGFTILCFEASFPESGT
jgi:hypothetical protein